MKFKQLSEVTPNAWRCEFHYPQSDGSVRAEWVDPNEVLLLQSRIKELETELHSPCADECIAESDLRKENAALRRVLAWAEKLIEDEDTAPTSGGYSTKELRKAIACVAQGSK